MRILLIDDDELLCGLLGETLRAAGHVVDEETDPRKLLRRLKSPEEQPAEYDVVVTDLFMPGSDGFEVLRAIREKFGRTRVAVISGDFGRGGVDYMSMAHDLGADALLRKPIRPEDLVQCVAGLADAATC